jgi:predicted PolB exonuclease-like 3'-5' exonuclease
MSNWKISLFDMVNDAYAMVNDAYAKSYNQPQNSLMDEATVTTDLALIKNKLLQNVRLYKSQPIHTADKIYDFFYTI